MIRPHYRPVAGGGASGRKSHWCRGERHQRAFQVGRSGAARMVTRTVTWRVTVRLPEDSNGLGMRRPDRSPPGRRLRRRTEAGMARQEVVRFHWQTPVRPIDGRSDRSQRQPGRPTAVSAWQCQRPAAVGSSPIPRYDQFQTRGRFVRHFSSNRWIACYRYRRVNRRRSYKPHRRHAESAPSDTTIRSTPMTVTFFPAHHRSAHHIGGEDRATGRWNGGARRSPGTTGCCVGSAPSGEGKKC